MKIQRGFQMLLHVETTARPAVRSVAEIKNFFSVFSVFKSEVWGWSTKFNLRKRFSWFWMFFDELEVFLMFFWWYLKFCF